MDMDFKPNSHKFNKEQKTAERRKVDKVVGGKVRVKKKSEIRKLADVFVAEDVDSVKEYVGDVIISMIKDTLCDLCGDIPKMIFFGTTSKNRGRYTSDRASYRDYAKRSERAPRGQRSGFALDDVIFDSRGDAEMVLDALDEMMEKYHMVRVADFYDATGETAPFTANDYGWMDIRNAEVVRAYDGYILKLPRPVPIR